MSTEINSTLTLTPSASPSRNSGHVLTAAPAASINKQSIAQSFGASAASYHSGAALQRNVGNNLLELMLGQPPRLHSNATCALDLWTRRESYDLWWRL